MTGKSSERESWHETERSGNNYEINEGNEGGSERLVFDSVGGCLVVKSNRFEEACVHFFLTSKQLNSTRQKTGKHLPSRIKVGLFRDYSGIIQGLFGDLLGHKDRKE
jgi:hypothetical protein